MSSTISNFPMKLFDLVTNESDDTVTWSEKGLGFIITDSKRFASETVPKHFRHSKISSFQRQLNLYGFQRVSKGQDGGSYYHPKFKRDRPELVSEVKRLLPKRKTKATSSSSHPSTNTTNNATSIIGNILTTRSNRSLSERFTTSLSSNNNFAAGKKQFAAPSDKRAAGGGARPPLIRVHCDSSRYEAKNVMNRLKETQNKDPDKKIPAISKLTRNLLGLPSSSAAEDSVMTDDGDITRRTVVDHRYSPRSECVELNPDLKDDFKIYRYSSRSPVNGRVVTITAAAGQLHHQPHRPPVLSVQQHLSSSTSSTTAPPPRPDVAVPTSNIMSAQKLPSSSDDDPTQFLDKVYYGKSADKLTGRGREEIIDQLPRQRQGVQALPRKLNLTFQPQATLNAPSSQSKDTNK